MTEAVIVSAVRTAVGKAPRGTLKNTRSDELGAAAIKEAVARAGVEASLIDDVIMGCAFPEASQGMNVARTASILAGLPVETSAMTVNRYCSSGLQTIALAAERIQLGGADAIVAGGLESMTAIGDPRNHRLVVKDGVPVARSATPPDVRQLIEWSAQAGAGF